MGNLYNPDNLELPGFEDSRLTQYIWEYSVGSFTHVIALNSERWQWDSAPEARLEFGSPFRYIADFHLMAWPEESYQPLPDVAFDFEQLDPSHPKYLSVRSQIASLLGEKVNPDDFLDNWREEATDSGFDKMYIQRWSDVRYEWKIRAWGGLTLKHLKDNLDLQVFGVSVEVEVDEQVAVLLETFEGFQETDTAFESLRYADPEMDAKHLLSKYLAKPTESLALEVARSLHRFGGPELVSFHFPELDLCRSCGELSHPDSINCQSRLAALRF